MNEMKKNYWKIVVGFCLIIVTSLVSLGLNRCDTPIGKMSIIKGVEDAVTQLQQIAFNQMISDEIIAKAITKTFEEIRWAKGECGTTFWSTNHYARHAVFNKYLRKPFKSEDELYSALYAAYSGGEWYYKDAGLPLEIDKPLNRAREIIMSKARKHLKDPKNLWSFYQAKKTLVLNLIKNKPFKQQNEFLCQIKATKKALRIFDSNERFQKAYQKYIKAYDEWWQTELVEDTACTAYFTARDKLIKGLSKDNQFRDQVMGRSTSYWGDYSRSKVTTTIPKGRQELYKIFEKKELESDNADRASFAAYKVMSGVEKKMNILTPNLWASLFAGRRFNEGGAKLVETYIRIADNLIKTLTEIQI